MFIKLPCEQTRVVLGHNLLFNSQQVFNSLTIIILYRPSSKHLLLLWSTKLLSKYQFFICKEIINFNSNIFLSTSVVQVKSFLLDVNGKTEEIPPLIMLSAVVSETSGQRFNVNELMLRLNSPKHINGPANSWPFKLKDNLKITIFVVTNHLS